MKKRRTTTMRNGVILSVIAMVTLRSASGEDTCPRPGEIAPCQCRTRGPSIQVR